MPSAKSEEIEDTPLQVESAKNVFVASVVETTDADFSGRIGNSELAKSYRVGRAETLEMKLARIERELDDTARMAEAERNAKAKNKVASLKDVLDKLSISTRPAEEFYSSLGKGINAEKEHPEHKERSSGDTSERSIAHEVAALEARVHTLEERIGLGTSGNDGIDKDARPLSVVLRDLQRKASLLTTNGTAVDAAMKNLEPLMVQAEKLQSTSRQITAGNKNKQGLELQETKINALYAKLGVIERLQSLAPALLSRLNTLQTIHADAAATQSVVRDIDETLSATKGEFRQWLAALEAVEAKIAEFTKTTAENRNECKKWIASIEKRRSNTDKA